MPRKKKAIQDQITELAQREYRETGRSFRPLYPWILVRILPKEAWSSSGRIVLPASQNKVLYEGIVLETYQPVKKLVDDAHVTVTCPLKPGDQIAFPHWDGFPVPFLNERTHRCIREIVTEALGGVPFKIEADDEDTVTQLARRIQAKRKLSFQNAYKLAEDILLKFTVIPTGQKAKFTTNA
jgi:co-chaperonin GroES (HSP10)